MDEAEKRKCRKEYQLQTKIKTRQREYQLRPEVQQRKAQLAAARREIINDLKKQYYEQPPTPTETTSKDLPFFY
jgi:hypothetical protein